MQFVAFLLPIVTAISTRAFNLLPQKSENKKSEVLKSEVQFLRDQSLVIVTMAVPMSTHTSGCSSVGNCSA